MKRSQQPEPTWRVAPGCHQSSSLGMLAVLQRDGRGNRARSGRCLPDGVPGTHRSGMPPVATADSLLHTAQPLSTVSAPRWLFFAVRFPVRQKPPKIWLQVSYCAERLLPRPVIMHKQRRHLPRREQRDQCKPTAQHNWNFELAGTKPNLI